MHVQREEMMMKSQSHSHVGVGDYSSSWEERAFAEDAARIVGGSINIWPQRFYSCTFCKRDFKSAQALGGHMNIHRRDRARLKQNLSPHHPHQKNDHLNNIKSLLGNINIDHHHFSAPDSGSLTTTNACYSSPPTATTCISSTHENCGQHSFSPSYSSYSIMLEQMGSPINSEQEGVVKARKYKLHGLGCSSYVETSLSAGLTSMFGQKSSPPTVPCGDRSNNNNCKRLKSSSSISSLQPLFLKPCSNDPKILAFQPLGLNNGIQDLDLELRLGKQHKLN